MTHSRRPVAARKSYCLPTLLGLAAVSAAASGCLSEASAQPLPTPDAGVRPTPPPRPHPPPVPHPLPPVTQPVPGGIGRVGPYHPVKIH